MVIAPLAGSETLPSERVHLTPHIGTQFPSPHVQLSAILASPNSEKLLNELANLISERGVVFFKAQDISPPQMKQLAHKLGLAVGKPDTSTVHRHPISETTAEFGDEVSVISSKMWVRVVLGGYELKRSKGGSLSPNDRKMSVLVVAGTRISALNPSLQVSFKGAFTRYEAKLLL
jgi:hypothetical protein